MRAPASLQRAPEQLRSPHHSISLASSRITLRRAPRTRDQRLVANDSSSRGSTTTILTVDAPPAAAAPPPAAAQTSSSSAVTAPTTSPGNTSGTPNTTKAAAIASALGITGLVSYRLLSAAPDALPPLHTTLTAAGTAAAALAAAALVMKAALGDRFHVELYRGRVHVLVGVPSQGPALQPGVVEVRFTGNPQLGNGAVSARSLVWLFGNGGWVVSGRVVG